MGWEKIGLIGLEKNQSSNFQQGIIWLWLSLIEDDLPLYKEIECYDHVCAYAANKQMFRYMYSLSIGGYM